MRKKHRNLLRSDGLNAVASSLFAIIIGLVFGYIVLLISNPEKAGEGISTILFGTFESGGEGIGQVLYFATPVIMTGLSVGFAFKTGLFNIGGAGQFIMGAFAAIYVGYYWTFLPAPFHWIVALIVATIVGGLWGLLPGVLKAYVNVHEVISTIMMNYIGMYLANYLVKTYAFDPSKNRSIDVAKSAELPKAGFDNIFYTQVGTFKQASIVNIGFIIAVAAAIIIYIVLEKTTFGYELKAVGMNKNASKYAGINEKRNIVLSMVIAGALAGLGGALLYLSGPSGRHINVVEELAAEGFNGIPVALLALSNPIGIVFSALFVSLLEQSGSYLQTLNYIPEVIDMIIAVIIYFSAFALFFRKFIPFVIRKREERKGIKRDNVNDEEKVPLEVMENIMDVEKGNPENIIYTDDLDDSSYEDDLDGKKGENI